LQHNDLMHGPQAIPRRLLQLAALLPVLLATGAAPAAAAPALGWSAPASFDAGNTPTAVSCPRESLCVAVDSAGSALTTAEPGSPTPHWSGAAIDSAGAPLQAVSCAAAGPCVAVDAHGRALFQASAGSGGWSTSQIDGGTALTGVSCPSATLCVAVDSAGSILWSTSPGSASWSSAPVDAGHSLRAVSCASPFLCVAVDDAGRVLSSTAPTAGAPAWRAQTVDYTGLQAVSCAASGCVAVDGRGPARAPRDPAAASATWSLTPIDLTELTAVSCAESGLCVAVDASGGALASDNATTGSPAWSRTAPASAALAGVSCLSGGLCVAADRAGRSMFARPPAPAVESLAPTQVSATEAVFAATVDPHDAALQACGFEYGTSTAYTATVPCGSIPSPAGAGQPVAATVNGLAPNTTYHYRALASTASGEVAGGDVAFTTGLSTTVAIVHPHPFITGTPASGQTLACHPGAEASATFAYAWIRDQVPIAEATRGAYTVVGRDSGHHLQCQVTATDGGGSASARSAFVTVPVGGVPAAAGETAVGRASYRKGRVSIPVVCSASAPAGCVISARLATVRGRRVVVLATAHSHLSAGAHSAIVLVLGKPGRRLIASRTRSIAQLSVTGTVVGVIQAQLAREQLTIGGGRIAKVSALGPGRVASTAPVAARARAAAHLLAATPYMGWDTYFALGGRYSESTVLEEASRLLTLGLQRRGFRYVWLDVGWWHGERGRSGQIEVSPRQWPHGMSWLASTLHAAGFHVGLYTDAGPDGCGGAGQGSYGHYQQDADTFASWGFDAVKVDFCGGSERGLEPAAAYAAFHDAIEANSAHRPMLLSICNFLVPGQQESQGPTVADSAFGSYSFGPSVGNSWRTDIDVGVPHNVSFASVLRNMDADAAAPQAAGPGHWNDPDYLAPDQGMNAAQFRTQLSMWSMLAAPLMISDDLRSIGASSLQALENEAVLAVDQDPAGVQAQLVSAAGEGEVWARPLVGGARAVALLNRGSKPITVQTSAAAVGLPHAARYAVRNLWSSAAGTTSGTIAARVAPYSTVLLRVTG
jgi:hypothetical protein